MSKKIDFSLFENALNSLSSAIQQPQNEFLRDSVIQRFEYTFEISWKSLKRYFIWNQGLDESNIKNLFREAGRHGLIDSVEDWFEFHRARNLTSHSYNEDVANEVFKIACDFCGKASALLKKLKDATK